MVGRFQFNFGDLFLLTAVVVTATAALIAMYGAVMNTLAGG